MYSFHGETVLDPFLGSGTTALAAMMEGRDSVGYEINPEFESIIRAKLGADNLFSGQCGMDFEWRKAVPSVVSRPPVRGGPALALTNNEQRLLPSPSP